MFFFQYYPLTSLLNSWYAAEDAKCSFGFLLLISMQGFTVIFASQSERNILFYMITTAA